VLKGVCSRFFGSIWRQRGALTLFVAPVLVVAVSLPATRAGQWGGKDQSDDHGE
jgi:hypothetical protein